MRRRSGYRKANHAVYVKINMPTVADEENVLKATLLRML
jgi:hypothetical protein